MANTTAPYSETMIAALAGDILDEFNVDSLDDGSPFSRFLLREFGPARDEFLQLYPWHVAQTRAALPVLTEEPAFGWDYQYQLPSDCLRLLPLREDGNHNGAEIPYELEDESKVLTNASGPLKVRYVKRLTNIAKWRPLMCRAFASRLAMYGATRMTGKQSYYQKAAVEAQRTMFEATHADSLERGTPEDYTVDGNAFSVRGLTTGEY